MHFYPLKVSRLTRSLLGHIVWKMDPGKRIIYLTFDDGPVPEATPWVLRRLEEFGAKATFFCVGHNIDKHPRIFDRILRGGHTPANHTYNHISGFKCSVEEYMENVWKAERLTGTRLFRPPYARITPEQYSILRKTFRIVLGDVIAGDFDPSQDVEYLRQNLLTNLEDGSGSPSSTTASNPSPGPANCSRQPCGISRTWDTVSMPCLPETCSKAQGVNLRQD